MSVPVSLSDALQTLPAGLRKPLIENYEALLKARSVGDWEKIGLKAGKLCETIYSILYGYVSGSFPAAPSKPPNMLQACTAFERADSKRFPRSVRIQMPRVLIAVYELRNNRAIGHVGGDVNPNHMDAEFFTRAAKWLMAELIRVFHNVTTDQAQDCVEVVSERSLPIVWRTDAGVRVLDPSLSAKDQTLLLVYDAGGATVKQLLEWIEYKNPSRYRAEVLAHLHKQRLIEFNRAAGNVTLLPPGQKYVEECLPSVRRAEVRRHQSRGGPRRRIGAGAA